MTYYPHVWGVPSKRRPLEHLLLELHTLRNAGKKIVTTNGCFDLLHAGHVAFLQDARDLGDVLIVGLNSDASVTRLKGPGRPFMPETDRAALLVALRSVDYVLVFDDLLPNGWLEKVLPHIHCKAGDYTLDSLPEAEVVRRNGGDVRILPLQAGLSTSALISRIAATLQDDRQVPVGGSILEELLAGSNVLRQTGYRLAGAIQRAADQIVSVLRSDRKVMVCGNGGSAADAQHFASELVGRFRRQRPGWFAIALTVDSSVLTSLGNDYGFEQTFARQVQALGRPGDLLIAISTSGHSANVLAAVRVAKEVGMHSLALTGIMPSPLADLAELTLAVPAHDTALIQQAHIAILHVLCEQVECAMGGKGGNQDV